MTYFQSKEYRERQTTEAAKRGYRIRAADSPKWWPDLQEFIDNEAAKRNESNQEDKSVPDLYCKKCHGAGWIHPAKADGTAEYGQVMRCKCVVHNAKYNG